MSENSETRRELNRRRRAIEAIWARFMASGLADRKRANELVHEAREIVNKEFRRIYALEHPRKKSRSARGTR